MNKKIFTLVLGACFSASVFCHAATKARAKEITPTLPPANIKSSDSYSFIVASHAYGNPHGANTGLYPIFRQHLTSEKSEASFLIFNGDIIRDLNREESWDEVRSELAEIGLPYYLVLGNHDYSPYSRSLLTDIYGGTYYFFDIGSSRYIILDTQESFLSVSQSQLNFLKEKLDDSQISKAFIFFHELLWNGNNSDYEHVMANFSSRSGYPPLTRANYWSEIHPVLNQHPEKKIYLFAGDLGGQADSIPAFYQELGHITLVANGMGAIENENYLNVVVSKEKVYLKLIPLREKNTLQPLEFYTKENLRRISLARLEEAFPRYWAEAKRILRHQYFWLGVIAGAITGIY